jgi:hypothetical protein
MVLKTLFLGFGAGAWASVRPAARPAERPRPDPVAASGPSATPGLARRPRRLVASWGRDAATGRLECVWRETCPGQADATGREADDPWSAVVASRLHRAACVTRRPCFRELGKPDHKPDSDDGESHAALSSPKAVRFEEAELGALINQP